MQSVVRTGYGPPEILSVQTLGLPVPKENEILVRVHAATVNRTDCGALWGKPFIFRFFVGYPKPRHLATGSDFAGTVVATGPKARLFREGDRVFGFEDHGLGSHAEYLCINENKAIAKIPEGISFEHAVASLEGGHYAYNFITKVSLKAGDRVLVNGATGAIGSAAVQILLHFGCEVTAVCPTAYVEQVRNMGAARVIDFEQEDFTKEPPESYGFVFDAVGKSSFARCKPLLKGRGVYISSELGPRSENPFLALLTPLLGGRRVIFPIPINIKRSIQLLSDLLVSRKFTPLIDREYPLTKIVEAFEYVASGKKVGNVLVKP